MHVDAEQYPRPDFAEVQDRYASFDSWLLSGALGVFGTTPYQAGIHKQDEKQVKKWVGPEFPGISERAKAKNAEIFFGDETGLQNTSNYAKGYAPIGKTPVVQTASKHIKINEFMMRIMHDTSKKVFLILDNLRVHHSKKVTAWLEKHKDEIEVFYLPSYAPEYNPDELLNSDLKRGIGK